MNDDKVINANDAAIILDLYKNGNMDITYELGDINGDGNINITDVGMVNAYVKDALSLTEEQIKRADVNGDSAITEEDVTILSDYSKNKRGDVNGDKIITASDYVIIKNYLSGNNNLTSITQKIADTNFDGAITSNDYILIKNYIMDYKGDLDGNDVVNSVDYVILKNYLDGNHSLYGMALEAADVNGDESISSNDYIMIKNYVMDARGDVNGDGEITSSDYVIVKNHVDGTRELTNIAKIAADVTRDGFIDAKDSDKIKQFIMGEITTL